MTKRKTLALTLIFIMVFAAAKPVFAEDAYAYDEAPPLAGRTIILDPGHGLGADNVFQGYSEQAAMLDLALRLAPLLEEQGATVILTRPCPKNVPLPIRAAEINLLTLEVLLDAAECPYEIEEIEHLSSIMQKIIYDFEYYAPIYFNFPFDWRFNTQIHPYLERIFEMQTNPLIADNFLFLSLHSNATPRPINTAINGADVYIMTQEMAYDRNYFTYITNEDRSRHFGEILLDNIANLGIKNRGVHDGNWFMIREHNLPGALVENGFHTSPHDRALLNSGRFRQRLAAAYEDAILRYFLTITDDILDETNPL